MSDVLEELADGITWLTGRRTGVRYHDLERILRRCGAEVTGRAGSHCTWSHSAVRDHLTLRMGNGELKTVYLKKTRLYLISIQAALQGNTDAESTG